MNASSTLLVNSRLSVATSSPDQTVNLAVNGGANISGTTTVGGLVATSSINITSGMFSSSATSTFANGIAVTKGGFSDDGVMLMKAYIYSSSTPAMAISTLDEVVTTGFQISSLNGTAWVDGASSSRDFCTFGWDLTNGHTSFTTDATTFAGAENSNLCLSNRADDVNIQILSTTNTSFTIRYNVTAGSYGAGLIKVNFIAVGN